MVQGFFDIQDVYTQGRQSNRMRSKFLGGETPITTFSLKNLFLALASHYIRATLRWGGRLRQGHLMQSPSRAGIKIR